VSIETPLRTIKAFGIIAALLYATPALPGTRRFEAALTLDSSDSALVEAFNWAKRQALEFAFDGDPVGSWYEAALPGREAFCIRDVAHQAMGAHALGLAPHTLNMLRRFAENISESKDWCSYWEIDRYNRPAPADYKSDTEFWYCLPANYDVLDACSRMYLWTGDLAYIDNPAFLNFYQRTVNDFEQKWNLDLNRVMKRRRFENVKAGFDPHNQFLFFRGNPSYDETREDFVLGVDLLATQYAAYRAYASIQKAQGNNQLAQTYVEKAAGVKALINNGWWDAAAKQFHARLNKDYQFEGHETSDVLYRDAVEDGPKLKGALDAFLNEIKKAPSSGVERQSHHAEILYRYGAPDAAYAQMIDLARPGRNRREYPEVSYSIVGAVVTGLIGISSASPSVKPPRYGHPAEQFISTQSGLGNIGWAELRNLPVRRNKVTVRHEGGQKTLFTNQEGPSVIWRPAFPGSFQMLLVNGKPVKARMERSILGREVSSIDVPVAPGVTVQVETPK
jgi:hypothetical protein